MIRGLYTAASALIAGLRRQEGVANNIANLATPGFKGEVTAAGSFQSVLVRSSGNVSAPVPLTFQRTLGTVGTGTYVAERSSYLANGELRITDQPLDVALGGPGFFAVQGPTGTLYTRNGHFTLSADGVLTTTAGRAVLGTDGEPRRLTIARDGDVRVGEELAGTLQIVSIPASALVRAGDTTFVASGEVTAIAGAALFQGRLEESNIDIGLAAAQLFAISQQFEANQRVFLQLDENLERAVSEIGRVA